MDGAVGLFLAERDEECRMCGYNLRGCGAMCPECGTEMELHLAPKGAQVWIDAWNVRQPPRVLSVAEAMHREVIARVAAGLVWVAMTPALWPNAVLMALPLLVGALNISIVVKQDAMRKRYERMDEADRSWRAGGVWWLVVFGGLMWLVVIAIRSG